ncbi:MAG: D-TA family PLP-dependent enzyme [Rhodothermia bacterium]|nr:MAG: D-TA family PLP-dependent enzyme [Rhodothermia bacterium]
MNTESIGTPCLLIDKDRLSTNLANMQRKADAAGARLRPHTKTHKSIDLARKQLNLGASGIAVAKVGEAEIFVAAGITDIRLAYVTVGEDKYSRIADLMEGARISFCVDTIEGATGASAFFSARDLTMEVLVEVDVGYGRCGVKWDSTEGTRFFKSVSKLPGLKIIGILTHAGHSYDGPRKENESKEEALIRVSNEERDRMLAFASSLLEAGLIKPDNGFEISIGSTPSLKHFENREENGFKITEIRPGNYVFHDRIQVGLGVATWQECALTVLTTVISKHRDADGSERLFLDAGRKVFTADLSDMMDGYGSILYNARTMEPLPHARFTGLSEEHGWVQVHGGATLSVGDRVRVVPNHACVVVNTQRNLYVVDEGEIVNTWTVDAQSQVV